MPTTNDIKKGIIRNRVNKEGFRFKMMRDKAIYAIQWNILRIFNPF